MKVLDAQNTIQSNMTGDRTAMGIAAEDMSHIMAILAGLYKNRLLAMIREYSTNAWDAHIESGNKQPIEVTLPNSLTPNLIIRDYGCGLSADDIRQVYSQYGRSTKRHTNDQVGMMGLGCKSALSYTQQFTVTSVKNSRKVSVLIALDEEGAGYTTILGDPDGTPTSDPSGTVVTIPIRREDIHSCSREADEFFKYWDSGSVLLNGCAPKRFEGLKIADGLYIIENRGAEDSRVVMGNVAYPHTIDVGTYKHYGDTQVALVAFVPIGAVKPTPAREGLMDVKMTTDTIERIKRDYKSHIQDVIQREMANCQTHHEAIRLRLKWEKYVPVVARSQSYDYKGDVMPQFFKSDLPPTTNSYGSPVFARWEVTDSRDYGYGNKSYTHMIEKLPIEQALTTIFVKDYEPAKFTATHKNKLVKWLRDNGLAHKTQRFILLREPAPVSPWFEDWQFVDWDTIKAIKLPVTTTAGGYKAIPGSYSVFTEDGYKEELAGSDIRSDVPLLWRQGNRWENEYTNNVVKELFPKFTFVCLPGNRIAKFCRDAPKAKEVAKAIVDEATKWAAGVNKLDLQTLAMRDSGVLTEYTALDPNRVDDPDLVDAIYIAGRDVKALTKKRDLFDRWVTDKSVLKATFANPIKKYPLYDIASLRHHSDDVYFYLNAKYEASKP